MKIGEGLGRGGGEAGGGREGERVGAGRGGRGEDGYITKDSCTQQYTFKH